LFAASRLGAFCASIGLELDAGVCARFGPIRPPVSVDSDHPFRSIPTTRFGVFDHPLGMGVKR